MYLKNPTKTNYLTHSWTFHQSPLKSFTKYWKYLQRMGQKIYQLSYVNEVSTKYNCFAITWLRMNLSTLFWNIEGQIQGLNFFLKACKTAQIRQK